MIYVCAVRGEYNGKVTYQFKGFDRTLDEAKESLEVYREFEKKYLEPNAYVILSCEEVKDI